MNENEQPQPPSTEEIWKRVTAAIHAAARDGVRIPKAVLDAKVSEFTNGQLASYDDLVQARQSQPDEEGQPGALASAAQAFGTGATMGLLPKLVGMASPETQQQMEDYAGAAREAHPIAAGAGSMAGGMAGGALLGGPMGSALEKVIPALKSLTPLMRAIPIGAATGGALGEMQGLGDQPGQEWDPMKALPSAGVGAASGLAGGLLGTKLAEAINPAPSMVHDLIRESAPAGVLGGVGSDVGESGGIMGGQSFKGGMKVLEALSEANHKLPKPLQLPFGFLNKTLKNQLMKTGQMSPQTADEGFQFLSSKIKQVEDAKDAIANHPTKGYDALLSDPQADAIVAASPEAKAIAKSLGKTSMTAKELQDYKIKLSNDVQGLKTTKARGEKYDTKALKTKGTALATINGVLAKVPGYTDLNAEVSPYLKSIRTMSQVASLMDRMRPRQVPVPAGDMGMEPSKALGEAIKSQAVGTTGLRRAKAARTITRGLLGAKNPEEFLNMTEFGKPWDVPAARGGGAITGLLGEPLQWARKKIGGLLGE